MLAVAGAFSSFPVMKHCNLSSSLVTGDAVSWVRVLSGLIGFGLVSVCFSLLLLVLLVVLFCFSFIYLFIFDS